MSNGQLELLCGIGDLKYLETLIDQGSEVNIMPLSIYAQLTNTTPTATHTRLSLANHSYVYPLGIEEDVLINVA